ncbi:MAG: DUF2341 domain-containing protein, partial [Candidatus Micrarchaeia archaeon]
DRDIIPADGNSTYYLIDSTGNKIPTNLTIYDRNGFMLVSQEIQEGGQFTRPYSLNDKYRIIFSSDKFMLDLNGFNISGNFNINPQYVINTSISNRPVGIAIISDLIALQSGYSFDSAKIVLPIIDRLDKICSCENWNFVTASCSGEWVCNSTSGYAGFGYNSTHFWFNVTHFTGYAGGAGYNANLTIYDSNDTEGGGFTIQTNQQAKFYANYSNSTSGSPINGTGVYCEITFNVSGEWTDPVNMTFNTSSLLYEYNRSFIEVGTYNWNVTCNGSALGYDLLTANDTIPVVQGGLTQCGTLDQPGETYTLTQNVSSSGTCFTIAADNITLDCQGYTINHTSSGSGVYASGRTSIAIRNCTVIGDTSSDNYGIYLNSVSNSSITNVTVMLHRTGIYLIFSSNNILSTIIMNSNNVGIDIFSSSGNTFFNLSADLNDNYGVSLGYNSQYNSLSDIITSNSIYGISITGSNNNISNITTLSNFYGISSASNYNNIIYNITTMNNYYGLVLSSSFNNTITNINSLNNEYGISLSSSSNNLFYNNLFNNTNNINIYFYGDVYENFWNTTLDCSSGPNIVGGQCIGGNFYATTSGNGFSETCTDNDGNGICDSAYTLVTDNIDFLPLAVPPIPPIELTTCGTLDQEGKTYILTQNVSSSGTCFTIAADNITFDCKGHTIETIDGNGKGIYLNGRNNVTIKNCIIDGNYSGTSSYYIYGIHAQYSNNLSIQNNTLFDNFNGIFLEYTTNSNITENNAFDNGNYGIFLQQQCNNNIISDNYASNNSYGNIFIAWNSQNNQIVNNEVSLGMYGIIAQYNIDNVTIANNTITSINGNGIYLIGVTNSYITNNNASGNGNGISASSSSNIIFENNSINNSYSGMWLTQVSYSNIINNRFNSIINNGLRLESNSQFNNITYNIFESESNPNGITVIYSYNNYISFNNLLSSTNYGLYFEGASNNSLYNNTILDSDYGIKFTYSSSNNLLINTIVKSERTDLISDYNSNLNTIINMTFNSSDYPTTTSFIYSGDVTIDSADAIPSPGYQNVSKYLNISLEDWIYLNITYTNDTIGENERDLRLFVFDGSQWNLVENGDVDTVNKIVFGNVTTSGIIAPLVDTTPPIITINSPMNTTYTNPSISFNISLSKFGTCVYSIDNSENYTMDTADNRIFTSTRAVDHGFHTVTFFCNDSYENLVSASRNFTVDLSRIGLVLVAPSENISVPQGKSFNVSVNVSCIDYNCGQIEVSLDPISGCSYKRQINIINDGSSLSEYQLPLTIDTQSLISENKMNADCSDLRFLDSDDSTQLPYWIESGCDTSETKVWVKIPSIQSQTLIYMYYGNPTAVSESNASAVFDFFDDFDGDSIDENKWVIDDSSGFSVSGGFLLGTNTNGRLHSVQSFSGPLIAEARQNITSFAANGHEVIGFYSGGYGFGGFLPHSNDNFYTFINNGFYGYNPSANVTVSNNWCIYKIVDDGQGYSYEIIEQEGTTNTNTQQYIYSINLLPITIGKRYDGWGGQSYYAYWDWIRVRKYTSNNVTYSIGNEESGGTVRKGLVSTNPSALPFYTINYNPQNISLNAGQSQIVSWTVYATGEVNSSYEFYVYANKSALKSISNLTEKWNVTISEPILDETAPSIQLISPSDNSYINSSTVTFTFNATDDTSNTLTCSIYIDNELNQTNNSIANGSVSQFVITGLSDNQHTWKINCSDEAENSNVSETRTFTIDTIPPSLSFVPPTPDNERSITTANVFINVSANENLSSCKLNWNSSEYIMTIQNADALTYAFYNITGFDFGTYSYYVTCNDIAGNFNSTETRNVSYIEYIEVVISPTSLNFGLLDPLTNSTSDISINVTNTENSNVPIYISFIGNDFISGSNILGIGNLTVRANATKPSYEYFTQDHSLSTDELSCTPMKYSLGQDCSNISIGQQVNLWFNIRIPGGQAAGDYIANITIKANGKT